jgi:O-antigen biosynthesis protein
MSILHKLRSKFLSPNSPMELWLRTLYHKLSATRLFFHIQDWRAKRSYQKWLANQNSQQKIDISTLVNQPKVSFLLNIYNAHNDEALATIQSIRNLDVDNWEIILGTDKENYYSELSNFTEDEKIKLIILSQENVLDLFSGAYIVFCAAGDSFHPQLLSLFYQSLNRNPSADIYYSDCDYVLRNSSERLPLFKPTALSPEMFLSVNYFSRGIINKDSISEYLSAISLKINILSIEYDIIFRMVEKSARIHHIPNILISQSDLVESANPNYTEIVKLHLSKTGLLRHRTKQNNSELGFSWHIETPSIAIIIPTKNHGSLLKNLISSIFKTTKYENFTLNLVDNDSDDEDTLSYYETLKQKPRFSLVPYHGDFNYSQAINLGAEYTQSDLLLFLNDDMEVIDPHWLHEMTQWAIRPDIGVVGAKLLRENHTIQHAGIILGLSGFAGHIHLNATDHYQSLFGSVDWYRNYLAVTGACQMVRREVFDEVGGYDEGFQIAFGDIDFCLRIHDLGYRNVYTPFARLYHYEGKSRGYSTPVSDILRAYEKHEKYLEKHDPYFSPNLTYTRIPRCVINKTSIDNRKQQIEERKSFYLSDKD